MRFLGASRPGNAWIATTWLASVIISLLFHGVAAAQLIHGGASTQPTSRPAAASQTSNDVGFVRIGLALVGVVTLIFFLRWGAKSLLNGPGASRGTSAISVLTRSTLAPRQQLLLIQVGRRVVLVGNSGSQMNSLCEISEPEEVSELLGRVASEKNGSIAKTFSSLFRKEEEKFDQAATQSSTIEEDVDANVAEVNATRQELLGLMKKVKSLSGQFGRA